MSQVWKRSNSEEDLENGWQTRQSRKKNRAHNRPMRMLRKKLQNNPKQKKNLKREMSTQHPPLFFIAFSGGISHNSLVSVSHLLLAPKQVILFLARAK